MLLAYIDSIEPLVASAHAQMQMKQAIIFVLAIFVGVQKRSAETRPGFSVCRLVN
jgi:hypothetical protein